MDDRLDCGHTPREHMEHGELTELVGHVQMIENPRVAVILTDSGEVHFVTTLPPTEAADVLERLAQRVRRYGGNYVRDHYDRGQASRWN